jgi:hypothetical protein
MALLRDSHAGGADTSPITVRTHPIGELQPNGLIDSVPTTGGRPPSLRAPDEPHSGLVVPGLPAERAVCRTCPPRGQKRSRRARSANDWFRRVRSSYAITLSKPERLALLVQIHAVKGRPDGSPFWRRCHCPRCRVKPFRPGRKRVRRYVWLSESLRHARQ